MRWSSLSPFIACTLIPLLVHAQGELGAPCSAVADGSSTGATPTCDSGFCRYNACSDPANVAQLGDVCTNENQCVGAESWSEVPAACAGLSGTTSTCGGPSAFCYADSSASTGPSSICASGICKSNQCAATTGTGVPPGGACTVDSACSGYARCLEGLCNDVGFPCQANDQTSTGPSDDCDTGYCRLNSCASFPASQLGEACLVDAACVNSEGWSETPAYCAGVAGGQATCGGPSAFCYADTSAATGSSSTCASGICKSNQCAAPTATGIPPGGSCSTDSSCTGYARCIDNTCNDVGFPCQATDNSATGTSDQCDTGYCRLNSCASFPASELGEACPSDASCINAESWSETPAYCAGVAGTQATCGGPSAFCYADTSAATGPSSICASGICKSNQCAAPTTTGIPPGGTCTTDASCSGYARCVGNVCNDVGFPCQATADGSATGPSDQCDTGYCRLNSCASFPASQLGEACSSDASCINAEGWSETPASCGGVPGTQATCGGASAFCYADSSAATGESSICASNICKSNQCAAVVETGVSPGGACTLDSACIGYARCIDGTCDDVGFPCTATDSSATGPSEQCDTGYCRLNGCASFPASELGEVCRNDASCINAETWSETPAYCAGPAGVPATCGGGSAFCYSLNSASTGFSPTCASGQCVFNQCRRVDPVASGGSCQGSFDCGAGISCVNGFCTGGEDTCAADDNNGQAIGTSNDCTSGFCRAGQCSNVPAAVLGDICDEDRDCSGFEDNEVYRSLLNCGQSGSATRRCGSGGAYCVALDGSPSGSAPALCISGQCLNYACTDVTPTPGLRKRVEFPVQQVIQKRLCPKGYEPCPLYPSGYECVDVLNDIESCGGCVGRNMPGVDCSADVHVAAVSCVSGKCVISACEDGFIVAVQNNTCIAA